MFVLMTVFLLGCMQDRNVKTSPEDVNIEATFMLNNNKQVSHKDYMVEMVIEKENGLGMVYPYMDGLHHTLSFDANEEEGYFTPGSLGYNDSDVNEVLSELKKNNVINDVPFSSFVGFHIPEETGTYKVRIYVQKDKNYSFENYNFDNMHLIYIHKENRNEWAKLIKIQTDLNK